MPKIKYQDLKLNPNKLAVIKQANSIIAEYARQGFDLTLRQLYYQFVARDLLPNQQKEYKRLGDIIGEGRLAGLIDWDAIVDRTRFLRKLPDWENPASIVRSCSYQFRVDRWKNQQYRPEVWIEKDALVGVIAGACDARAVPYFSCRGYTSLSELWSAAQRLLAYQEAGQTPVILHFGDHDPSGMDMSRDIADRLATFGLELEVNRLALNYDQIQEFNPPPNPCKLTDSRANGYIARFGYESWELDALDPTTLAGLISSQIEELTDADAWAETEEEQDVARQQLAGIAGNYTRVVRYLQKEAGR